MENRKGSHGAQQPVEWRWMWSWSDDASRHVELPSDVLIRKSNSTSKSSRRSSALRAISAADPIGGACGGVVSQLTASCRGRPHDSR